MAGISAQGETKSAYAQRANQLSRELKRWLDEHRTTMFRVSYCGKEGTMLEYLRGTRLDALTIRASLDICAARALSDYFSDRYPDFPQFRSPVTQENQMQVRLAAMEALGGRPQKLGLDALDALELMDDGRINPEHSH